MSDWIANRIKEASSHQGAIAVAAAVAGPVLIATAVSALSATNLTAFDLTTNLPDTAAAPFVIAMEAPAPTGLCAIIF